MQTKTFGPVSGLLLQAWLPIALIALWWFASAGSTDVFWPSLGKIVDAFWAWATGPRMLNDLVYSFGNYFAALILSIGVGVGIGTKTTIGSVRKKSRNGDSTCPTRGMRPIAVPIPTPTTIARMSAAK